MNWELLVTPHSGGRSSTMRWPIVFLMALLVGSYYLWAVRASGTRFEWKYDLGDCYDLLGRGFAGGHLYLPIQPSPLLLAQPNPWDPGVDPALRQQDMVLYNGRYYLYFGAAPAVLLFTPWRLLTGHDLPQTFAMFLLCFGGFLCSCGSMLRILDFISAKPSPALLAILLLALGVCQSIPYLLNRVAVYEIAIAGGYFGLSAAVFCLTRSVHSPRGAYWLGASGLMFGFAVASRPHLVFAGMIALAGQAVFLARRRGLMPALRSRELLAFANAFALAGLAIGTYNYQRFGNPFEFGFRYQLAGPGQNRIELAPRNLLPGFYFMLLSRPEITPVFPWMRMVFRFPFDSAERFPLPPEYFVEPSVGALWVAPMLIAALCVPTARRLAIHSKQNAGAEVRSILWTVTASTSAILLFLMSTHLATHRYEIDFVALGIFAAVINLSIYVCESTNYRRVILTAIVVVLISYSIVTNLALGLAGPYDDVLKNRPASYLRIARWFSPIREFRPAMNSRINVELAVTFIPEPPGYREPLITIGHSHYHHFLYVEHAAEALRLVSQSEDSKVVYEIPDPPKAPVSIRLVFSPASHRLTVELNGQQALVHPLEMLITAPAEVAIGENFSDLGLTARRFTGTIHVINKRVE